MASDLKIVRENDSLTGPAERRILAFTARNLSTSVTPDQLTCLGVLGALLTFAGYIACNLDVRFLWLANLGLFLHWFGDSMDGSLARYRQREKARYGFFLDQTTDVLTNILIVAGMGLSPYISFGVAMLALAGYHALSIHALIIALLTGRFRIAAVKIGATELRLLLLAMNLMISVIGADIHTVFGIHYTWCDVVILFFALSFLISFIISLFHGLAVFRDSD